MEKKIKEYARFVYGWDSLAKAVELGEKDPPILGLVYFQVEPMEYNGTTGEPMLYRGKVDAPDAHLRFEIRKGKNATWTPHDPCCVHLFLRNCACVALHPHSETNGN